MTWTKPESRHQRSAMVHERLTQRMGYSFWHPDGQSLDIDARSVAWHARAARLAKQQREPSTCRRELHLWPGDETPLEFFNEETTKTHIGPLNTNAVWPDCDSVRPEESSVTRMRALGDVLVTKMLDETMAISQGRKDTVRDGVAPHGDYSASRLARTIVRSRIR